MNNNGYLIYQAGRPLSRTELRAVDNGARGGCPQPVGADNLCHQAIFANDASGAIAPPKAEVVQVGDAIGAVDRPSDWLLCL